MPRGIAVLALLAAPLAASAQTATANGTMTFNVGVVGTTECAGSSSAFSTSWTFVQNGLAVQPSSTNVYNLFVSTTAFTNCGSTVQSAATVPNGSGVAPVTTGQTQTFPPAGTTETWADVAAAASATACSADGTLYFCAQLLQSASTATIVGSATGSIAVQVAAPGIPTLLAPAPGDGRLYLYWTPSSAAPAADHYQATLTASVVCSSPPTPPCDPTQTHAYANVPTSQPFAAGGLVNGVAYDVVLRAVSAGGAVSGDSNHVTGTPVPVNDFWDQYTADGGREKGGCATGSGGLLALVGALAALRGARRRS